MARKTCEKQKMIELKKVPVIILNGFLGSGKTTLFRSLLSQSKKKNISVCAIVNDMSELDVDGELIGNTNMVEENNDILISISSCVLSSKIGVEKLDQAVQKLLSNQELELIIIETSGSCHPMPLIEYFKDQEQVKLTGVLVLVDSLMLAHDFNYGESLIQQMQRNIVTGKRDTTNLLVEQILFCSHLILTKADRIEAEKLPDIATYVQQINPLASTHSVIFGNLTIESLFELKEYDYFKVTQLIKELKPILENEEHDDRPYDIETRVIKDDRPFHPQRLWEICHQYLDKRIYRSKGFFWLASRDKQSLLWQQAAGGISLELIGFWRSGIVEDKDNGLSKMEIESLKELLAKESGRFGDRHCDLTVIGDKAQINQFTDKLISCFLTEEEIELWNAGCQFEDPWPKNIVNMQNKT
ncbi:MAG: Putative metal chaperone YciC [Flavobacterium sp. SCGC AAA160-P02]|nr:MAG: Putative metal chaperone YciC [Flavobacterium sp. SCGC AAA160-P02]